jgi:FkbM family methyltransferase
MGAPKSSTLEHVAKHDDLIYDVGLHKGEDTDFYLKKGFRVIAFEADPALVRDCQEKFAEATASGRLVIVPGAVVKPDEAAAGTRKVKFFHNRDNSVWGTIDPFLARRNEQLRTRNEVIEVDAVDFAACIRRFGMPYYMKIDIEGADLICVETLLEFDCRPTYLSIESEDASFKKLRDELDLLERLGYAEFAAVQQEEIELQVPPQPAREGTYVAHRFEEGSSGLFGRDLPAPWESRAEIEKRFRKILVLCWLFGGNSLLRRVRGGRRLLGFLRRRVGRPLPGWYDTHARLASER